MAIPTYNLNIPPHDIIPGHPIVSPRFNFPRFYVTEISLNFNIAQDLCKSNAHMIYFPRFSPNEIRFNIAQDLCKSNAHMIYFPRFSPNEIRFNIGQDVCKSNAVRIPQHRLPKIHKDRSAKIFGDLDYQLTTRTPAICAAADHDMHMHGVRKSY